MLEMKLALLEMSLDAGQQPVAGGDLQDQERAFWATGNPYRIT